MRCFVVAITRANGLVACEIFPGAPVLSYQCSVRSFTYNCSGGTMTAKCPYLLSLLGVYIRNRDTHFFLFSGHTRNILILNI